MRAPAALACAVLAAGFGCAHAARATTAPGTIYVSKLVITDGAIRIRVRRNTWSATLRYPRGAEVRYEVSNRGTHPFSLNILGSTTGRLAPGRGTSILVYWARRGSFVFRASPTGPRLRVLVT